MICPARPRPSWSSSSSQTPKLTAARAAEAATIRIVVQSSRPSSSRPSAWRRITACAATLAAVAIAVAATIPPTPNGP